MKYKILIVFLLFGVRLYAMIGQTESQMNNELGAPFEKTAEGFNAYRQGSMVIHAHFTDGISDNTVYIANSSVPFSDHIISGLLCVESSGLAWIVDENSLPERVMYSTPDNKFHAILLNHNKLSVFTDTFLQKRKRDTGK